MDAVEYLKAKGKMTKNCTQLCSLCLLGYRNNIHKIDCGDIERKFPEIAIGIVEKWSKENPVETYKSVFFKKFPNAPKCDNGYPLMYARFVFGGNNRDDSTWREDWDEEYQEPSS